LVVDRSGCPKKTAKDSERALMVGYYPATHQEGYLAMMNAEMMRQLQAKMQKVQEDLARQTVEATAGGGAVTVTVSEIGMGPAQAKLQSVKISADAVDPDDVETLEDLVLAAVNEALAKAQATAAEQMSALTGGMRVPGLF
jgi:DNA-binding YbaB/EbfC family protein